MKRKTGKDRRSSGNHDNRTKSKLKSIMRAHVRYLKEEEDMKVFDASTHTKSLWADPVWRERQIKIYNSPEYKEKQRITALKNANSKEGKKRLKYRMEKKSEYERLRKSDPEIAKKYEKSKKIANQKKKEKRS